MNDGSGEQSPPENRPHSESPARALLCEIGVGTSGVVTEVTGEPEDTSRLKAMGICQGRLVRLVRSGDPLIVQVLGTRVGLSSRLARNVFVRDPGESAEVPQ